MRLSPRGRKIVKAIREELRDSGVRLIIRKSPSIYSNKTPVSGFFEAHRRRIVIATKGSEVEFFAVLFHEMEHFRQWRDYEEGRRTKRARIWENDIILPDVISPGHTKRERLPAYHSTLASERGAEIAQTDRLRRYQIGTEEERAQEMRGALIYLYLHKLFHEKNKWYRDDVTVAEYARRPDVALLLPKKIRGTNFGRIPKKLRKILLTMF